MDIEKNETPNLAETPKIPSQLYIPNISEKKLQELYSNIKPIVEIDGKKHLLRDFERNELRNYSYTWDPHKDKRDVVDDTKLDIVQDFYCLHTWAYYGLFKPTIAEVLAQMPKKSREQANFFEIVDQPRTVDDLAIHQEITDAGYHLSRVRTYKTRE